MDPLTTAAVTAGRRYLLGKVLRWVAVLLPLVLVGGMALLIYTTLVLGGDQTEDGSVPADACIARAGNQKTLGVGQLTGEQVANARTIVAVGRKHDVPDEGIHVALITALQESNLNNVPYGDRDSVGLFQQREAWGTYTERMDPATSAEMFYTGGRQGQPGLLDIHGWRTMAPTVAAQAVQVSAFPTAYAKWETTASELLGTKGVGGARCSSPPGGSAEIVKAAQDWMGTPYSWGGGGIEGPSEGFAQGAGTKGFDCSSLVQYAVYASTGTLLPRTTSEQARVVEEVALDEAEAGDLLFFHSGSDPDGVYHHVGIYDGRGGMVHAPRTGKTVERVAEVLENPYWESQLTLVGRVAYSSRGDHGKRA